MFPAQNTSSFLPLGALALSFLLLQEVQAPAQRNNPSRNSPTRNSATMLAAFKPVVAQPSQSTVRVISSDEEVALGTIVSSDGYIVTKASELGGRLSCKLKDGRVFHARIVGVDETHDLAMLKIEASKLTPIQWAPSKSAEVGHWLVAPGIGDEPVAIGVVSVAVRKPSRLESPRTAPKQNSGYLGVVLEPTEEGTPVIGRISEGSPAQKAGFKVGDVVLSVSGRAVKTTDRLIALIQSLRPGQTVDIRVRRGEEEKELTAKLTRFPQNLLSRGDRMNMMGSELSYRLGGFPVILQHDLLIKPRDCGGPVVDLEGKAVGINIARAGRTESYALPSETVQALIPDLKSGKLAPHSETDENAISKLENWIRKLKQEVQDAQQQLRSATTDDEKKAAEQRLLDLRDRLEKAESELEKAQKNSSR